MNTIANTTTRTETIVSADGNSVTEFVPDPMLASYRRRQHKAGRFITRSVMCQGGYYVTTTTDPR